jgi:hypothetical protein
MILSIPKAPTRWRGDVKGLLHESQLVKPAENLGVSPLKRNLSKESNVSQTNFDR